MCSGQRNDAGRQAVRWATACAERRLQVRLQRLLVGWLEEGCWGRKRASIEQKNGVDIQNAGNQRTGQELENCRRLEAENKNVADEPEICSEKFEEAEKGCLNQSGFLNAGGGCQRHSSMEEP